MKNFILPFFFITAVIAAQPQMEMQPYGFDPIKIDAPPMNSEKFIELTQNWAMEYNRREGRYDITGVSSNTVTVSAYKNRAFYYRNLGEAFEHKIRYSIDLTFNGSTYTLNFKVIDIYSNDKLLEYKIPDYFKSDGKLKDGYAEIEQSLESTVNEIVRSHYNFLANFN